MPASYSRSASSLERLGHPACSHLMYAQMPHSSCSGQRGNVGGRGGTRINRWHRAEPPAFHLTLTPRGCAAPVQPTAPQHTSPQLAALPTNLRQLRHLVQRQQGRQLPRRRGGSPPIAVGGRSSSGGIHAGQCHCHRVLGLATQRHLQQRSGEGVLGNSVCQQPSHKLVLDIRALDKRSGSSTRPANRASLVRPRRASSQGTH